MAMGSALTDEADLILSRERVYLAVDVPELSLFRGAAGIVRSAWLYPQRAYEVEFAPPSGRTGARLLLLHEQIRQRQKPTQRPTAEVAACEGPPPKELLPL